MKMILTVKFLQTPGKECSIEVTAAEPILSIKRMVAKELDVPVHLQRLVFKGKTLADEQNLCDYNIGPDTKIHLVIRRPDTDADILSTSRIGTSKVLWDQTRTFLAKHFTPADTEKVLQQFKKEFSSGVSNLSLDDIERIATARLNAEVDKADEAGPSS